MRNDQASPTIVDLMQRKEALTTTKEDMSTTHKEVLDYLKTLTEQKLPQQRHQNDEEP